MSTDAPSERGSLAEALIAARTEARLSQRELAAKSDVSLATIRDIELGKQRRPKQETLESLASGLAKNNDGSVYEPYKRRHYMNLMRGAGYRVIMVFEEEPDRVWLDTGRPWESDPKAVKEAVDRIVGYAELLGPMVRRSDLSVSEYELIGEILMSILRRIDPERWHGLEWVYTTPKKLPDDAKEPY